MNTKQIIGLITFGAGIGGSIASAIWAKRGYDHGERKFLAGMEFGIKLKELEVYLEKCHEENKNNSEHNE